MTPELPTPDREVPQGAPLDPTGRIVLGPEEIARALRRIAHEILESNKGAQDLVLLGIPSRGVELAQRLAELIEEVEGTAELVAAVNGGLLTVDEVCERYGLTLEEFAGWQRSIDRSGMPGLRVTRIQHYRDLYERQQRF